MVESIALVTERALFLPTCFLMNKTKMFTDSWRTYLSSNSTWSQAEMSILGSKLDLKQTSAALALLDLPRLERDKKRQLWGKKKRKRWKVEHAKEEKDSILGSSSTDTWELRVIVREHRWSECYIVWKVISTSNLQVWTCQKVMLWLFYWKLLGSEKDWVYWQI